MPVTPKAIQLLNILTDKEVRELKTNLVSDKKLRALIITETILKQKNTAFGVQEKNFLYQKLFEEEYSSEKDYLLRNEFRLLSKQIEHLLVQEAIKEEIKNNETSFHYYLLKSLQDRKALPLFQKEYNDTYDKALEHKDYYAAHNITGLNFINFTQFLNIKEKDLPYIEKLQELKLNHLSCFYLAAFRQHQIDQQYLQHSLFPFSTEQSSIEKKVEVNFEPFETDYSDYLFLKAKTYIEPPNIRIKTLAKCLQLAEQYFIKNENLFEKEVKFCLSAIAKTYVLLTDYEQANTFFDRFFEKFIELDNLERLATLVEYIANLINLNHIPQAIEILEENAVLMKSIPRLKLWHQVLKTACCAFMEDTNALSTALPVSYMEYDLPTKYFFRFYLAILAYLEGRIEDAFREIDNLRHLTAKKKNMEGIHSIVNFFHRYFYTLDKYSHEADKHLKNLQKLDKDIAEYAQTALPEFRSYLPFLWLIRKIKI